jgi:retinol dehydrogenase-14
MEREQHGLMHGKVCLVTGATGGIGRATAEGLARLGATVIIVSRNLQVGQAAIADIEAQTGNNSLELFLADLSSQAEIHRLAQAVIAKHEHLHVLINNVGNMQTQRRETVDGIELTFALNVLTPFLLTHLLLPLLKASAPARIINVNSTAHRFVSKLNFDDLQATQDYRGMDVYSKAKLANLLFTYELARRLDGSGCAVNAADPGFTISAPDPASARPWYAHTIDPFIKIGSNIMTTTRAARSSIYIASSPALAGISGKYVTTARKAVKSSQASYDEVAAQKLWQACMQLSGLAQYESSPM